MCPKKIYSFNDMGAVETHDLIKEGSPGWKNAAWYRESGAVAKLVNMDRLRNTDDGKQYYADEETAIKNAILFLTNRIERDTKYIAELKEDLKAVSQRR